MTSRTTRAFRDALTNLPPEVRRQAIEAYRLWRCDPRHPSLHFKKVHVTRQIWSVRIGLGWRALGVQNEDAIVWFWIGSHAEYDRLIS